MTMETQESSRARTQRPANPVQAHPRRPPRVQVLTPTSGEVVTVGHPVLICWYSSCIAVLVFHQVRLSTDGGATYSRDISPLLDGKELRYLWPPR